VSNRITLASAGDAFEFDALHTEPHSSRRGGVVLLQEIFGLDRYMEDDAARWVALGFEVVAPSLFDRTERGFVAEHDADGIQRGFAMFGATGFEVPLGDIRACVDFLAPRGPVFVIGYCYGGSLAWLAAARITGIAAVSCYYGGSIVDFANEDPLCPAICHFGRRDPHIPADDATARIVSAQPNVPVYLYEQSGHGFNNAGSPDSDPADADSARARTLDLFLSHTPDA
jgi:carboxymethylenebutenolidase